jgi:hypothetical protein
VFAFLGSPRKPLNLQVKGEAPPTMLFTCNIGYSHLGTPFMIGHALSLQTRFRRTFLNQKFKTKKQKSKIPPSPHPPEHAIILLVKKERFLMKLT